MIAISLKRELRHARTLAQKSSLKGTDLSASHCSCLFASLGVRIPTKPPGTDALSQGATGAAGQTTSLGIHLGL